MSWLIHKVFSGLNFILCGLPKYQQNETPNSLQGTMWYKQRDGLITLYLKSTFLNPAFCTSETWKYHLATVIFLSFKNAFRFLIIKKLFYLFIFYFGSINMERHWYDMIWGAKCKFWENVPFQSHFIISTMKLLKPAYFTL